MHQTFSTIVSYIIAPENWIILLLIWLLLTKSLILRKRLTLLVVVLILILGNQVLYNKAVVAWQPKPVTLTNTTPYEAGIVLGGSSSFDKYRVGYLNSSADRFIETCILYKTGKIKKIIISGGSNQKKGPKDALFQQKKMLELGIPGADIIVEDSSTNTFENAAFTKMKIDSLKLHPPFVMITSAMHVPRAQRVFTKAGIAVIPFPCDYKAFEQKFAFTDYFIPSLSTLLSWNGLLKEVVGVIGYWLFNKA